MCVSGWRVIWEALHPRKEINDGVEGKKKKQHNLAVISEERQKIIAGE